MKSIYRNAFLMLMLPFMMIRGHAAPVGDAGAIIGRSLETYRSMKSLDCQEQISTQISSQGMVNSVETSATIRMARPDLFLIVWRQPFPQPKNMPAGVSFTLPDMTGAVWNDGQGIFTYMGLYGQSRYEQYDDKSMGLAAATGVSGGAAHVLPSIFFDWLRGINLLKDLRNARLVRIETVKGEDCDVIVGENSMESVKLWISQKSHLILKVQESRQKGKMFKDQNLSNKAIDEALKADGEKSTPENRERMRRLMEKAKAATENMQMTSTLVFLNVKPGLKLEKADFKYAVPADAVLKNGSERKKD